MKIAYRKTLQLIFFALAGVFSAYAQDVSVKITILSTNQISVDGRFKDESASMENWSFLAEYADATNLADRVSDLQLFDNKGEKVEAKRFNPAEYVASRRAATFKYLVNLSPSKKLTDAAHASWLTENSGILMLSDLLPQFKSESVWVDFDLPADVRIGHGFPLLEKVAATGFKLDDAVFWVGRNWRERQVKFGDKTVRLAIAGTWQFTDEEAVETVKNVVDEYRKFFGDLPVPLAQIILSPFPQENSNGDRWRAETRGATVTVISGALPHRSQQIQRLAEQLRHEVFHLWLPNSLDLSGNYDWFYEGFTVYNALRTGVELNQIRFEDFLNTLGKAYDLSEGSTNSLLDASNKRWSGSGNFVYAKGLVVAFLCDAALLQASKGKRNLGEVFRRVWNKHRFPNKIEDGNSAILNILKTFPELMPIVANYVEGSSNINWDSNLQAFGIVSEKSEFGVRLKISSVLNGRQKDLLDKLGYNQWRKMLQKTR